MGLRQSQSTSRWLSGKCSLGSDRQTHRRSRRRNPRAIWSVPRHVQAHSRTLAHHGVLFLDWIPEFCGDGTEDGATAAGACLDERGRVREFMYKRPSKRALMMEIRWIGRRAFTAFPGSPNGVRTRVSTLRVFSGPISPPAAMPNLVPDLWIRCSGRSRHFLTSPGRSRDEMRDETDAHRWHQRGPTRV